MRGLVATFCACLAATSVRAQSPPDAQSARLFVEHVYAAYEQPDAPSSLGRRADMVFAPALLREIRADQTGHPGDIGKLDHDPLCDCQDTDGLKSVEVEVTPAPDGKAGAAVRFKLGDMGKFVRLELVTTPDGWRVGDVSTETMRSLLATLASK